MFVRYFIDLDDPFEHVEAALLVDPSDWVPGMARAAGELGDGLLAEVGFAVRDDLRIDKAVEIWIGEAHQASEKTRLPMSWKATGPGRLFPSLDADLEVAGIGTSRTQLTISAGLENLRVSSPGRNMIDVHCCSTLSLMASLLTGATVDAHRREDVGTGADLMARALEIIAHGLAASP